MGLPRTKQPGASRFRTSLTGAVSNVSDELRRFGADSGRKVENVVISSNCSLANLRPADAGVAVYFTWDGIQCCIAIDRYKLPEENLQAITIVIEAERTKLRHGGLNIVRAAFRGYAALPPPNASAGELPKPWRDVLKLPATARLADVEERYKSLVKEHHPDRGGDPARFNEIVEATRQAREDMRA
jgi:hypothetical protein